MRVKVPKAVPLRDFISSKQYKDGLETEVEHMRAWLGRKEMTLSSNQPNFRRMYSLGSSRDLLGISETERRTMFKLTG